METFSVLLALCDGESTGYQWIPLTKGQYRGVLMLFQCRPEEKAWIYNGIAGDFKRHDVHMEPNA